MGEMRRTIAVIEGGIGAGLHRGAQVYVRHNDHVMVDAGFGEARPGAAMTKDSVMLWLSAGKPIVAMAVAKLVERGEVGLDEPVASYVQEFGVNGKEAVTVGQVLRHTGGFRWLIGVDVLGYREAVERVCAMGLEKGGEPGQRAGYHIYTGWYVLAEIVRRVDGRPIDLFVVEEIFEPLGMVDCWIGIPHGEQENLGDALSINEQTMVEPIERIHGLPDQIAMLRPSSNYRGPVRQLGRFYAALLARGRGVFRPDTVERFTVPSRVGMVDETFGVEIDWSLGFMIHSVKYGARHAYDFGPHASERSYGHAGNQCSCGFVDPAHRLVVAWACNGQPGERAHQERNSAINAAIYEDLGLA